VKRWRAAVLVVAVLACRDISTLRRLATDLNAELPGHALGVSLTDQILLTVTATDTALAMASCETQVGFALRVARFLPDHYDGLDGLQVVSVTFALPDGVLVPLSHARLPIRFNPTALRAGLQPSDSVAAVGSCKAFAELNQG
jgi:hypothetical protein